MPSSASKLKPKRQTLAELRRLQRLAGAVIFNPLSSDFGMQKTWKDGRPTSEVVSRFIKPNDRLTSFERIEIYNKQYWFRLIDNLFGDFPGMVAVLGDAKFNRLARAYGAKYPSRSFTLRNLSRHMPQFMQDEPHWAKPYEKICQDMAKFEWAQVVAFDGPAKPPITADDLVGRNPAKLRLALQPHLTILDLRYPLDDYTLAVKKSAMRSEASNAVEESNASSGTTRRIPRPRPRRTVVAVYRMEGDIYFKRLTSIARDILSAIGEGKTLVEACEVAFPKGADGATIKEWFENWTALGWFCKRS